MSLEGAQLICLDEDGNRGEIVKAKGRKFTVGYYVSCDCVVTDDRAKGVHCAIECDAFGRITIRNMSAEHPVLVNGSTVSNKLNLFNKSIISILDKRYLWEHSSPSAIDKDEATSLEEATTPRKQIGIPEPTGFSSPSLKTKKCVSRFTVHNFAYCIQSDADGNISVESNENNESSDNMSEKKEPSENPTRAERHVTPEPESEYTSTACVQGTPKMNLLNSTNNKENTGSTQKKNRLQLSMCHQSEVVITSFSPRETGVRTEKSFTAILMPKVLVTRAPNTPKSVYTTPKSVLGDDDEIDRSRDMNFHTPSTSKKAGDGASTATKSLKNSSMHLVDYTTPKRLAPASPYLKSALKASAKKQPLTSTTEKILKNTTVAEHQLGVSALPYTPVVSDDKGIQLETPNSLQSVISVDSTDTSSIIEILSDESTPGLPSAKTPQKAETTNAHSTTPMRTPQSLIKRAILTNRNKQVTTPQRGTANVQTTPRREPINRIPLRSSIGALRSPVAQMATVSDVNTHSRQSISTPSRTSLAASAPRFENTPTANTKFATPSPSRRSLMAKSACKATSTPLGTSYYNRYSGCNTTPLNKVRKSFGGVPLSNHISKARKSIIEAAPSNFTSIKEKSPQQKVSDKILYRARKSVCVTPMVARAIQMVQAAKDSPNSILKQSTHGRKSMASSRSVLFEDKRHKAQTVDCSLTFILDSDDEESNANERKNNEVNVTKSTDDRLLQEDENTNKYKGSKPKEILSSLEKEQIINLTFSPRKEEETEQGGETSTTEEIPVDVDEVPQALKEPSDEGSIESINQHGNIVTIEDSEDSRDSPLKQGQDNDVIHVALASHATEESFAEEILDTQKEEVIQINESSESVRVTEALDLDSRKIETGFGEEPEASIAEEFCVGRDVPQSKSSYSVAIENESISEMDAAKSHCGLDKSSHVYHPIYEDITLESSVIEKEVIGLSLLDRSKNMTTDDTKNNTGVLESPKENVTEVESTADNENNLILVCNAPTEQDFNNVQENEKHVLVISPYNENSQHARHTVLDSDIKDQEETTRDSADLLGETEHLPIEESTEAGPELTSTSKLLEEIEDVLNKSDEFNLKHSTELGDKESIPTLTEELESEKLRHATTSILEENKHFQNAEEQCQKRSLESEENKSTHETNDFFRQERNLESKKINENQVPSDSKNDASPKELISKSVNEEPNQKSNFECEKNRNKQADSDSKPDSEVIESITTSSINEQLDQESNFITKGIKGSQAASIINNNQALSETQTESNIKKSISTSANEEVSQESNSECKDSNYTKTAPENNDIQAVIDTTNETDIEKPMPSSSANKVLNRQSDMKSAETKEKDDTQVFDNSNNKSEIEELILTSPANENLSQESNLDSEESREPEVVPENDDIQFVSDTENENETKEAVSTSHTNEDLNQESNLEFEENEAKEAGSERKKQSEIEELILKSPGNKDVSQESNLESEECKGPQAVAEKENIQLVSDTENESETKESTLTSHTNESLTQASNSEFEETEAKQVSSDSKKESEFEELISTSPANKDQSQKSNLKTEGKDVIQFVSDANNESETEESISKFHANKDLSQEINLEFKENGTKEATSDRKNEGEMDELIKSNSSNINVTHESNLETEKSKGNEVTSEKGEIQFVSDTNNDTEFKEPISKSHDNENLCQESNLEFEENKKVASDNNIEAEIEISLSKSLATEDLNSDSKLECEENNDIQTASEKDAIQVNKDTQAVFETDDIQTVSISKTKSNIDDSISMSLPDEDHSMGSNLEPEEQNGNQDASAKEDDIKNEMESEGSTTNSFCAIEEISQKNVMKFDENQDAQDVEHIPSVSDSKNQSAIEELVLSKNSENEKLSQEPEESKETLTAATSDDKKEGEEIKETSDDHPVCEINSKSQICDHLSETDEGSAPTNKLIESVDDVNTPRRRRSRCSVGVSSTGNTKSNLETSISTAATYTAGIGNKSVEILTPRRTSRRKSITAQLEGSSLKTPVEALIEADEGSTHTPRRSSRKKSTSAETCASERASTAVTPRRYTRRASMSVEVAASYTPTRTNTKSRRASLSSVSETPLTPKPITRRRSSTSIDADEAVNVVHVTNESIDETIGSIFEDIKEDMGAIIEEDEEAAVCKENELDETVQHLIESKENGNDVASETNQVASHEKASVTADVNDPDQNLTQDGIDNCGASIDNGRACDIIQDEENMAVVVDISVQDLTEDGKIVYIGNVMLDKTNDSIHDLTHGGCDVSELVNVSTQDLAQDVDRDKSVQQLSEGENICEVGIEAEIGLSEDKGEQTPSEEHEEDMETLEVSDDDSNYEYGKEVQAPLTPKAQKYERTMTGTTKTPTTAGVRKLLKTPKREQNTPNLGAIRHLVRSPKFQALERDDEKTGNLQCLKVIVKTPIGDQSKEVGKDGQPSTSSQETVNDLRGVKEMLNTPKSCSTPRFKGMRELLKTPKMSSTPFLSGVKELLDTPKQDHGPKSENTEETDDSDEVEKDTEKYVRGVKEMLNTPKSCATPRFKGMRELLKTPKMSSTPVLSGVKELLDTPKQDHGPKSENTEETDDSDEVEKDTEKYVRGVKEMLNTPKSCATPRFKGMRELLKTPKMSSTPVLSGVKELLDTPKQDHGSKSENTEETNDGDEVEKDTEKYVRGVKEMLNTPKSCATPRFKGMRELLKTPKMSSTPVLSGVKELLDTPKEDHGPKYENTEETNDGDEVQKDTEKYARGVKELQTPKSCATPHFKGMRELLKTPKVSSTPALCGVKELLDTPNQYHELQSETTKETNVENDVGKYTERDSRGVKEMLNTPKSCATPPFKGMRELLKTPKMSSTPVLSGVKELLDTPKQDHGPKSVNTEETNDGDEVEKDTEKYVRGVKELKTPLNCATPLFKGMRELMKTPKVSSTPILCGVKELLDTPKQDHESQSQYFEETGGDNKSAMTSQKGKNYVGDVKDVEEIEKYKKVNKSAAPTEAEMNIQVVKDLMTSAELLNTSTEVVEHIEEIVVESALTLQEGGTKLKELKGTPKFCATPAFKRSTPLLIGVKELLDIRTHDLGSQTENIEETNDNESPTTCQQGKHDNSDIKNVKEIEKDTNEHSSAEPNEVENELQVVKDLTKTRHHIEEIQVERATTSQGIKKDLREVKDVISTTKSCATPSFKGIRELMKTPKVKFTPILGGVKELLGTPKQEHRIQLTDEAETKKAYPDVSSALLLGDEHKELLDTHTQKQDDEEQFVTNQSICEEEYKDCKDVKELMKTPKGSSTPLFKGIRELMKTPRMCSTPVLGGIKELMNTPTQDKCNLDKFLKTPTAKNIMIPILPSSAVIEKSEDSVEMVHSIEYDLNDTHEGGLANLGELFKTPVASCFVDRLSVSYSDDDHGQDCEEVNTSVKEGMVSPVLPTNSEETTANQQTPSRKVCRRKSLLLKTPLAESPFSAADVLTDLSKSEVEDWVDKIDPLEQTINLNNDDDNEDKDVSKPRDDNKVIILDNFTASDSLSVVPETCVKVPLANDSTSSEGMINITTVNNTTSKDPLRRSTTGKSKQKNMRPMTPSETADISGIDLLDETAESVLENSLVVSDDNENQHSADNFKPLNATSKQDDTLCEEEPDNNLSEPLLLSDDDESEETSKVVSKNENNGKSPTPESTEEPVGIDLSTNILAQVQIESFSSKAPNITEGNMSNKNIKNREPEAMFPNDPVSGEETTIKIDIAADSKDISEAISNKSELVKSSVEKDAIKASTPKECEDIFMESSMSYNSVSIKHTNDDESENEGFKLELLGTVDTPNDTKGSIEEEISAEGRTENEDENVEAADTLEKLQGTCDIVSKITNENISLSSPESQHQISSTSVICLDSTNNDVDVTQTEIQTLGADEVIAEVIPADKSPSNLSECGEHTNDEVSEDGISISESTTTSGEVIPSGITEAINEQSSEFNKNENNDRSEDVITIDDSSCEEVPEDTNNKGADEIGNVDKETEDAKTSEKDSDVEIPINTDTNLEQQPKVNEEGADVILSSRDEIFESKEEIVGKTTNFSDSPDVSNDRKSTNVERTTSVSDKSSSSQDVHEICPTIQQIESIASDLINSSELHLITEGVDLSTVSISLPILSEPDSKTANFSETSEVSNDSKNSNVEQTTPVSQDITDICPTIQQIESKNSDLTDSPELFRVTEPDSRNVVDNETELATNVKTYKVVLSEEAKQMKAMESDEEETSKHELSKINPEKSIKDIVEVPITEKNLESSAISSSAILKDTQSSETISDTKNDEDTNMSTDNSEIENVHEVTKKVPSESEISDIGKNQTEAVSLQTVSKPDIQSSSEIKGEGTTETTKTILFEASAVNEASSCSENINAEINNEAENQAEVQIVEDSPQELQPEDVRLGGEVSKNEEHASSNENMELQDISTSLSTETANEYNTEVPVGVASESLIESGINEICKIQTEAMSSDVSSEQGNKSASKRTAKRDNTKGTASELNLSSTETEKSLSETSRTQSNKQVAIREAEKVQHSEHQVEHEEFEAIQMESDVKKYSDDNSSKEKHQVIPESTDVKSYDIQVKVRDASGSVKGESSGENRTPSESGKPPRQYKPTKRTQSRKVSQSSICSNDSDKEAPTIKRKRRNTKTENVIPQPETSTILHTVDEIENNKEEKVPVLVKILESEETDSNSDASASCQESKTLNEKLIEDQDELEGRVAPESGVSNVKLMKDAQLLVENKSDTQTEKNTVVGCKGSCRMTSQDTSHYMNLKSTKSQRGGNRKIRFTQNKGDADGIGRIEEIEEMPKTSSTEINLPERSDDQYVLKTTKEIEVISTQADVKVKDTEMPKFEKTELAKRTRRKHSQVESNSSETSSIYNEQAVEIIKEESVTIQAAENTTRVAENTTQSSLNLKVGEPYKRSRRKPSKAESKPDERTDVEESVVKAKKPATEETLNVAETLSRAESETDLKSRQQKESQEDPCLKNSLRRANSTTEKESIEISKEHVQETAMCVPVHNLENTEPIECVPIVQVEDEPKPARPTRRKASIDSALEDDNATYSRKGSRRKGIAEKKLEVIEELGENNSIDTTGIEESVKLSESTHDPIEIIALKVEFSEAPPKVTKEPYERGHIRSRGKASQDSDNEVGSKKVSGRKAHLIGDKGVTVLDKIVESADKEYEEEQETSELIEENKIAKAYSDQIALKTVEEAKLTDNIPEATTLSTIEMATHKSNESPHPVPKSSHHKPSQNFPKEVDKTSVMQKISRRRVETIREEEDSTPASTPEEQTTKANKSKETSDLKESMTKAEDLSSQTIDKAIQLTTTRRNRRKAGQDTDQESCTTKSRARHHKVEKTTSDAKTGTVHKEDMKTNLTADSHLQDNMNEKQKVVEEASEDHKIKDVDHVKGSEHPETTKPNAAAKRVRRKASQEPAQEEDSNNQHSKRCRRIVTESEQPAMEEDVPSSRSKRQNRIIVDEKGVTTKSEEAKEKFETNPEKSESPNAKLFEDSKEDKNSSLLKMHEQYPQKKCIKRPFATSETTCASPANEEPVTRRTKHESNATENKDKYINEEFEAVSSDDKQVDKSEPSDKHHVSESSADVKNSDKPRKAPTRRKAAVTNSNEVHEDKRPTARSKRGRKALVDIDLGHQADQSDDQSGHDEKSALKSSRCHKAYDKDQVITQSEHSQDQVITQSEHQKINDEILSSKPRRCRKGRDAKEPTLDNDNIEDKRGHDEPPTSRSKKRQKANDNEESGTNADHSEDQHSNEEKVSSKTRRVGRLEDQHSQNEKSSSNLQTDIKPQHDERPKQDDHAENLNVVDEKSATRSRRARKAGGDEEHGHQENHDNQVANEKVTTSLRRGRKAKDRKETLHQDLHIDDQNDHKEKSSVKSASSNKPHEDDKNASQHDQCGLGEKLSPKSRRGRKVHDVEESANQNEHPDEENKSTKRKVAVTHEESVPVTRRRGAPRKKVDHEKDLVANTSSEDIILDSKESSKRSNRRKKNELREELSTTCEEPSVGPSASQSFPADTKTHMEKVSSPSNQNVSKTHTRTESREGHDAKVTHTKKDEVNTASEDSPSKRGRNMPQRRAATQHHSYDETSDSDKTDKRTKKEAAKSTHMETIVLESSSVPSPTLSSSAVTARGRTRKPTARVQQFLEEERAKAETPKKRAALAAAVETPTKGKPVRRGAKTVDTGTKVVGTSQTNKQAIGKTAPIADESEGHEDEHISPITAKGRKGSRKAKADVHGKRSDDTEEPPAKKSPAVLEAEKDKASSPKNEASTPTRVASRRNAAAAAKFRIEEDALATAAADPPNKLKAKKQPAKATAISEKRDHRLLSASTVEEDDENPEQLTNPPKEQTKAAIKRGGTRKATSAAAQTTDSKDVELPAKKSRKGNVATEIHESDTEPTAVTTSSRSAATTRAVRRNVHFESADKNTQSANIEDEPATTNKRATRVRRK